MIQNWLNWLRRSNCKTKDKVYTVLDGEVIERCLVRRVAKGVAVYDKKTDSIMTFGHKDENKFWFTCKKKAVQDALDKLDSYVGRCQEDKLKLLGVTKQLNEKPKKK